MKTLLAVGLGVFIGLAAVPGEAQPGGVRAKIPFEFRAGGKILPAGEYRMIVVPHRVDIQDAHGKKIAALLANETAGRSAGGDGRIVFRCYREWCFLSEVWSPDYEHGQQVSSRFEVEMRNMQDVTYVAIPGESRGSTGK